MICCNKANIGVRQQGDSHPRSYSAFQPRGEKPFRGPLPHGSLLSCIRYVDVNTYRTYRTSGRIGGETGILFPVTLSKYCFYGFIPKVIKVWSFIFLFYFIFIIKVAHSFFYKIPPEKSIFVLNVLLLGIRCLLMCSTGCVHITFV